MAAGPAARGGRVLSAAEFEERCAPGARAPSVVVAAGPDSWLADLVLRAAVAAALGDADSPHAVVLHGPSRPGDTDAPPLAEILDEARTLSLFAGPAGKVVVVRRADAYLAEGGDAILAFAVDAPRGSRLFLACRAAPGSRDAPRAVASLLEALAPLPGVAVVSCAPPSDQPPRGGGPSPLATWVAGRARARGKRLDAADAGFLVERSGTALATLDAAVAAAALAAGDAARISLEDLEAVAPRGPAEGTDRFTEALLSRDAPAALRALGDLYRDGAAAWGGKAPVRGDGPVTWLLLAQARRLARDTRGAVASRGGGGFLPPSLRFGCRDPGRVLRACTAPGLAALLADLAAFEADLKSGASGAERERFEALVLRHAGEP